MLVIDSLVNAIREAKKYNSNTQIAPAAVLWTDKDRQWESVINKVQVLLPELDCFRCLCARQNDRTGDMD